MRVYAKPLAGGGSRIIHRRRNGRFFKPSLGADVCPDPECLAFNLPETTNEGSERFPFMKIRPRATCRRCGVSL